jgi:hypothetical protein
MKIGTTVLVFSVFSLHDLIQSKEISMVLSEDYAFDRKLSWLRLRANNLLYCPWNRSRETISPNQRAKLLYLYLLAEAANSLWKLDYRAAGK